MCLPSLFKLLHAQAKALKRTTKKQQQTFETNNKTTNTGHPAHHPTANKSLSGSGWEILYFVCLSLLRHINNEETNQGHPLLYKEILYCRMKSLAVKEIPYHIMTSLTIEGNALRTRTNNPWKSLTTEGSPSLINTLLKKLPYYRKTPLTIL